MDHISLNSNNHSSGLINSLDHFKAVDSFVDVTLVSEGHNVKAHKIILSAGSNLLRRLLLANPAKHPIIILAETKYDTLRIIIDFLYKGSIDVPRNDLQKLLQVATAFEINELKKLCEENLNSKKADRELNSYPSLITPDLSGSSPKKKCQRKQSIDSDILIEATVPKKEIDYSPCMMEHSDISPLTEALSEATQTEFFEFHPQITETRSLIKSSVEPPTENDLTDTYIQKKDAFTECGIQPLKELRCNFLPIKLSRETVRPRFNEKSDDSGSDTQNKLAFLKKRKRSMIWQYFTAVTSSYAVCRICRGKFSYRTTVTNLTKHLHKKHKRFDLNNPPKLPEVPLLRVQSEQLEVFEEIDFNSIEGDTVNEGEHLQYKETDESIPSTSTPCILKIT